MGLMAAEAFDDPRIGLHRIYTRHGDGGTTRLVNGRQVRKDDPRVEAYGTIDELNACVGRARAGILAAASTCPDLKSLGATLLRIQHELFNLGSQVATDPGSIGSRQPRILTDQIECLESEIDEMNAELPALVSFVLPGGTTWNADLHMCRTVCRRAERVVVSLAASEADLELPMRYLNRLSDAFFVWTRWACHRADEPEVLWEPNRAS